jgi:hypothetical protein
MVLLSLATLAHAQAFDEDSNPQFGSVHRIHKAPASNCVKNPADGIRWQCPVQLDGISADALFMVDKHRWTGIMAVLRTDEETGKELVRDLEVEWGPGTQTSPTQLTWTHDDIMQAVQVQQLGDDDYGIRVIMASLTELQRVGVITP